MIDDLFINLIKGKEMGKAIVTLVLMFLFSATSGQASLAITSPKTVCPLLSSHGLSTGSWKKFYGNNFGCISPYKEIGSGIVPNNLGFYVEGDDNSVTQTKLVLNVNNKSLATSAHSALLNSSETLSIKIAGVKLSPTIKNAITKGRTIKEMLGKTSVEVKRDNWPSGKGYELQVVFK